MSGDDWQPIETAPENLPVMTKLDDANGCRNEQKLIMRRRSPDTRPMWWFTSGDMYVYYTPTHWKFLTDAKAPTPAAPAGVAL